MKNKVSLTYSKKDGLEVKVGKKIIPLSIIADPLEVTLGFDQKTIKLELFLDHLAIKDIEAIAEYVRFK
jgi:hypothetical protein